MLAIQSFKTEELSGGYEHDSSPDYAKGPRYWRRTLNVSYGQPQMMLVFTGLLLLGCAFGQQRKLNLLIAAWSLPLAVYLLWFVSPKPDHYLLPLLIPVFSAGFDLIPPLMEWWEKKQGLAARPGHSWGTPYCLYTVEPIQFPDFQEPDAAFHVLQRLIPGLTFFLHCATICIPTR